MVLLGGGRKLNIDLNIWKGFKIGQYFYAKNTGNILTREISDGTGNTPYVTASSVNNGVVAYIDAKRFGILNGNCILVGGKTFTLTYQKEDFVSNDSHNFTLKLIDAQHRNEQIYLFFLTALRRSLSQKYSWGDAVTKEKILSEYVFLPSTYDGQPDWNFMEDFIKFMKMQINNKIVYLKALTLN